MLWQAPSHHSHSDSNTGYLGDLARNLVLLGRERVGLEQSVVPVVLLLLQVDGLFELRALEASLQELSLLFEFLLNFSAHHLSDAIILGSAAHTLQLCLHLRIQVLDVVREVVLFLAEEFELPGPEGLKALVLNNLIELVVFVNLHGIADQLDVRHLSAIVATQT